MTQSQSSHVRTLIVLGAGPKAMAIAAKRAALRREGFIVPNLKIVDRRGIASHWTGENGFTDGRHSLGTPPDKDLGFPYARKVYFHRTAEQLDKGDLPGPQSGLGLSSSMLGRFSYQAYLAARGRYAEYVDAGKPHPSHWAWAEYLRWAAQLLDEGGPEHDPGLEVITAEVDSIDVIPGALEQWELGYDDGNGGRKVIRGDGLIITGPGEPKRIMDQPIEQHPRYYDGRTFWEASSLDSLKLNVKRNDTIGVVGTGETAASVLVGLQKLLDVEVDIVVYCPHGMLFSRGESYWENQMYSEPMRWMELSLGERQEFIERTDRGVLSPAALAALRSSRDRIVLWSGHAWRVNALDDVVHLSIKGADGKIRRNRYDFVVNCTGFEPLWFRSMLTERAQEHLKERFIALHDVSEVKKAIRYDLSLHDLEPRLHLPMVSALSQGPGFPNLSSLGALSDRILSSYAYGRLPDPDDL